MNAGRPDRRRLPFLIAVMLVGCDQDAAETLAEPRVLQFTPAHTELPLRLVHHGTTALPLTKLRIDQREADWSAFTISDATLPREIEPGGAVTLHLRVDADHFKGTDPRPRAGAAALTFLAGGQPQRVPLRFAAPEPPAFAWPVRLGSLTGLTVAGLALSRWQWPWVLLTVVAVAIAPLGAGVCLDPGAVALTAADLQQCADGRGGLPLQILPHVGGLGLYIAGLLFLAARSTATEDLQRAPIRPITLALAVLAAATVGGGLDPQVLIQAQQGQRWGLWQQPLGALALIFAAVGEVHAARAITPWTMRIAAFGLAAMITTLCLGGPDLPGVLALPHSTSIAAGLTVWMVKTIAVGFLLVRTRMPVGFSRAITPLALAQILLSAWVLHGL